MNRVNGVANAYGPQVPFKSFTEEEAQVYEQLEREKEAQLRQLGEQEMANENEYIAKLRTVVTEYETPVRKMVERAQMRVSEHTLDDIFKEVSGLSAAHLKYLERYEQEHTKIMAKFDGLCEAELKAPKEMVCDNPSCSGKPSFMVHVDHNTCVLCERDLPMTHHQIQIAKDEIQESLGDLAVTSIVQYGQIYVISQYRQYIRSLPRTLEALRTARANATFSNFAASTAQSLASAGRPVASLADALLLPFERIFEMYQVMQEAFKTCDELHEAYDELEEGIERMGAMLREFDVLALLDDYKRCTRLLDVYGAEHARGLDILDEDREVVMVGEFRIVRGLEPEANPVQVLILDNSLVWTTASPPFTYLGHVPLAAAFVAQKDVDGMFGIVVSSQKPSALVHLAHTDESTIWQWRAALASTMNLASAHAVTVEPSSSSTLEDLDEESPSDAASAAKADEERTEELVASNTSSPTLPVPSHRKNQKSIPILLGSGSPTTPANSSNSCLATPGSNQQQKHRRLESVPILGGSGVSECDVRAIEEANEKEKKVGDFSSPSHRKLQSIPILPESGALHMPLHAPSTLPPTLEEPDMSEEDKEEDGEEDAAVSIQSEEEDENNGRTTITVDTSDSLNVPSSSNPGTANHIPTGKTLQRSPRRNDSVDSTSSIEVDPVSISEAREDEEKRKAIQKREIEARFKGLTNTRRSSGRFARSEDLEDEEVVRRREAEVAAMASAMEMQFKSLVGGDAPAAPAPVSALPVHEPAPNDWASLGGGGSVSFGSPRSQRSVASSVDNAPRSPVGADVRSGASHPATPKRQSSRRSLHHEETPVAAINSYTNTAYKSPRQRASSMETKKKNSVKSPKAASNSNGSSQRVSSPNKKQSPTTPSSSSSPSPSVSPVQPVVVANGKPTKRRSKSSSSEIETLSETPPLSSSLHRDETAPDLSSWNSLSESGSLDLLNASHEEFPSEEEFVSTPRREAVEKKKNVNPTASRSKRAAKEKSPVRKLPKSKIPSPRSRSSPSKNAALKNAEKEGVESRKAAASPSKKSTNSTTARNVRRAASSSPVKKPSPSKKTRSGSKGSSSKKLNKSNSASSKVKAAAAPLKNTVAELKKIVTGIEAVLNTKDSLWTARDQALGKLRRVCAAHQSEREGPVGDVEFARTLQVLIPSLKLQLGELRSMVVKEACRGVGFIALALEGSDLFKPYADVLLPPLIDLTRSTTLVVSQSADECVRTILGACALTSVYDFLIKAAVVRKGVTVQCRLLEYLTIATENWPLELIEDSFGALETHLTRDPSSAPLRNYNLEHSLSTTMTCPAKEVRLQSRRLFLKYFRRSPETAGELFRRLKPQVQVMLCRQSKAFCAEAVERHLISGQFVSKQVSPSVSTSSVASLPGAEQVVQHESDVESGVESAVEVSKAKKNGKGDSSSSVRPSRIPRSPRTPPPRSPRSASSGKASPSSPRRVKSASASRRTKSTVMPSSSRSKSPSSIPFAKVPPTSPKGKSEKKKKSRSTKSVSELPAPKKEMKRNTDVIDSPSREKKVSKEEKKEMKMEEKDAPVDISTPEKKKKKSHKKSTSSTSSSLGETDSKQPHESSGSDLISFSHLHAAAKRQSLADKSRTQRIVQDTLKPLAGQNQTLAVVSEEQKVVDEEKYELEKKLLEMHERVSYQDERLHKLKGLLMNSESEISKYKAIAEQKERERMETASAASRQQEGCEPFTSSSAIDGATGHKRRSSVHTALHEKSVELQKAHERISKLLDDNRKLAYQRLQHEKDANRLRIHLSHQKNLQYETAVGASDEVVALQQRVERYLKNYKTERMKRLELDDVISTLEQEKEALREEHCETKKENGRLTRKVERLNDLIRERGILMKKLDRETRLRQLAEQKLQAYMDAEDGSGTSSDDSDDSEDEGAEAKRVSAAAAAAARAAEALEKEREAERVIAIAVEEKEQLESMNANLGDEVESLRADLEELRHKYSEQRKHFESSIESKDNEIATAYLKVDELIEENAELADAINSHRDAFGMSVPSTPSHLVRAVAPVASGNEPDQVETPELVSSSLDGENAVDDESIHRLGVDVQLGPSQVQLDHLSPAERHQMNVSGITSVDVIDEEKSGSWRLQDVPSLEQGAVHTIRVSPVSLSPSHSDGASRELGHLASENLILEKTIEHTKEVLDKDWDRFGVMEPPSPLSSSTSPSHVDHNPKSSSYIDKNGYGQNDSPQHVTPSKQTGHHYEASRFSEPTQYEQGEWETPLKNRYGSDPIVSSSAHLQYSPYNEDDSYDEYSREYGGRGSSVDRSGARFDEEPPFADTSAMLGSPYSVLSREEESFLKQQLETERTKQMELQQEYERHLSHLLSIGSSSPRSQYVSPDKRRCGASPADSRRGDSQGRGVRQPNFNVSGISTVSMDDGTNALNLSNGRPHSPVVYESRAQRDPEEVIAEHRQEISRLQQAYNRVSSRNPDDSF